MGLHSGVPATGDGSRGWSSREGGEAQDRRGNGEERHTVPVCALGWRERWGMSGDTSSAMVAMAAAWAGDGAGVEEGRRGAMEDVGDGEVALALTVGRRGRQRRGLAGLPELGGTTACSGQRAEEASES
jgi:hypothetical protein